VFTRMRLFLLLSCLFAVATADAGADADADLLQLLGEETEPGGLRGPVAHLDKLGESAWFWCAPVPR
jgi:hypothetical protein